MSSLNPEVLTQVQGPACTGFSFSLKISTNPLFSEATRRTLSPPALISDSSSKIGVEGMVTADGFRAIRVATYCSQHGPLIEQKGS